MKKTILFAVALILLSNHAKSGVDYNALNRDSLRAIINNHSLPDTTRLRNAMFLIRSFDYVIPDSMHYYARIYHDESVKANYLYGIAFTLVADGWYYAEVGQKNEAMKNFLAAIKPAEELGQLSALGFVYGEVGGGYSQLQMIEKATEFHLKAIKIYRDLHDPQGEMIGLSNLVYEYESSGNFQKALEIELHVFKMLDSLKISDTNMKASVLDGLGTIYKNMGRYAESIKSYDEARKLHQQNNNLYFYNITLFNMVDFFLSDTLNLYGKEIGDNRKSADIALAYLEELISLNKSVQDSSMLIQCYVMSANAFLQKGETNKAIERAKEAEALKFNDQNLPSMLNYTGSLADIYRHCQSYKKAMDYYIATINLIDSLDRSKMAEKVEQLNESFQVEQVQGQLSQKEQQLAKSRVITWLFIALSALILIMALVVSYFLRQKQKAAKLLEQQNREIEKARNRAEQSEKFKERFLASMSHEIRTPLNAVIGMTGLLLDDPQPPKTESYLKNIRQAGEHLTGIINEILDLSRIDAGKLELHETTFSLQKLLDEIGIMTGIRAKEKDLQLIIHKEVGSPDWVSGDSGRIRQVLLNLAGNAVKFTERGSVQVKMTGGEPVEGKTMVTFSVEDTGPGIPKELQAAIFEEFVQAGQEGEQKVAGTGLGLSISRKLVERMGGTLSLESEPGKGSVFSFSIPMVLSSEEAFNVIEKEKELSVSAMKGSFRILVVEDNPSNQIVTEGMLEKILPESTAILAEDGFKALELLEKEKFDLVLMDIRMPGIDGYETTRRLRLLGNENAKIPVIALTASVIRADIQHCLEAGMNGYVPKPVSRAILTKAIRDQLKITPEESFITAEVKTENFLAGMKSRPTWAERLFDLCNGKKDRFVRYLEIFQSQSVSEIGSWQEMIDQQQYERLAFSIHKLLPHIRIFLEEQSITDAVLLDQELRKGWSDKYAEELLSLKQSIYTVNNEASALMQAMN
jgi:signal transduction histidine kinase/AmiR/NasT family two-component response regulator